LAIATAFDTGARTHANTHANETDDDMEAVEFNEPTPEEEEDFDEGSNELTQEEQAYRESRDAQQQPPPAPPAPPAQRRVVPRQSLADVLAVSRNNLNI
jgi:hypothetical protein